MKKLLAVVLTLILTLSVFAGCVQQGAGSTAPDTSTSSSDATTSTTPASTETSGSTELQKIVIGASPTPHAEILAVVKEILAEQGYELDIREYTDYIQPNLALDAGDLDANYFQHQPYLDDFNAENKTEIVSIAGIHYEPFGIYPGKTKSFDDLKDGAEVSVPNDSTNEARALLLLEAEGLIKLNKDAGLKATVNDITENPKNLKIREIEAAQLARSLQDVDIAVINGNYAIAAGLNATTDALAQEDKDSLTGTSYTNIVAVRKGDEGREDLQALVKALQSDKVKQFIEDTFDGTVVPVF